MCARLPAHYTLPKTLPSVPPCCPFMVSGSCCIVRALTLTTACPHLLPHRYRILPSPGCSLRSLDGLATLSLLRPPTPSWIPLRQALVSLVSCSCFLSHHPLRSPAPPNPNLSFAISSTPSLPPSPRALHPSRAILTCRLVASVGCVVAHSPYLLPPSSHSRLLACSIPLPLPLTLPRSPLLLRLPRSLALSPSVALLPPPLPASSTRSLNG